MKKTETSDKWRPDLSSQSEPQEDKDHNSITQD
jgi:hypothetical protein